MDYSVKYLLPNEASSAIQFYKEAWEECTELQVRTYQEALTAFSYSIHSIDRIEVIIPDVGGMIITDSDDMHVGQCLVSMWCYIRKPYRNKGLYRCLLRELRHACHKTGISNYLITHRIGVGKYENIYRSIAHGRCSQEDN